MSNLLKSKFFLGFMIVAILFVGAFSVVKTTNAQQAIVTVSDLQYTTTVKLGSVGQSALIWQRFLNGYSTTAQLVEDSHFGKLSVAQAKAWQASRSLTADGVLGAMSRAAAIAQINENAPASAFQNGCTSYLGFSTSTGLSCAAPAVSAYPTGCTSSAGYSTTTGESCALTVPTNLPTGCTSSVGFSSTTGMSCGTTLPTGCTSSVGFSTTTGQSCGTGAVISPTGQGSATLDYEPVPAAGVSIYTGASKQAGVTFKIRSTGSNMSVNNFSLDVNDRIWLEASNAYLMQGSTVLATVPLNSSTVTEVTAGSLWRIQFSGFNVVAPVGMDTDLTVAFDRPTVTQNNNTVAIQTSTYMRTTDGTGFTSNVSPTTTRAMNFSGSAATSGLLTSSLNVNSPLAQSVSGLSSTVSVLTPVKLMDFDLKGQNSAITVTTLYGTATASTGTIANEVASFELRDGSTVLASVTGGATATFSSLNIQIPENGTKTLSVWAQMNPICAPGAGCTSKGAGITFTLVPNAHTLAYDANYNTVTDTTASVAGNTQYMFKYAPTITFVSGVLNPIDETGSGNANNGATGSIVFNVTAPSGSDIYFNTPYTGNATGGLLTSTYAASKYGTGGGALVLSVATSGTAQNGATLTTWDKIPAGSTKTITVTGYIPHGTGAGFVGMTLATDGINWTDTDSAAGTIAQTWGLTSFQTNTVHVTNN